MPTPSLTPADRRFLTEMIPHHQAAIDTATQYLATPSGQRLAVVSDMARAIVTAQTAEIATMRDWLGTTIPPPTPMRGN